MNSKSLNRDAHTVIGVDLGGTNVRAGLIVNGKLVNHADAKIPQNDAHQAEVLQTIINVIKKVFTSDVQGIGIGVPGLVDKEKGVIHSIVNIPSFDYVEISKILYDIFKVAVELENDTNCFALGEKYFGNGKDYSNMVGLSIGTGMSAGIISNNMLIEGANSGSGEFGEIPYLDSKMEAYCSGQFFKENSDKSGEELFHLANSGDEEALKLFNQMGMHLAKAIKIIILSIDPEVIIIGGSVSKAHKHFHKAMMEELKNFTFQQTLEKLEIIYTSKPNSPIFGAASLILLKPEHNTYKMKVV